MLFSIIYSVDVPKNVAVSDYAPPELSLWEQTEDDDRYEFAHLQGRWESGHHRQWAGILDRGQFDRFVLQCGLTAEDVQTLGWIGAPGCGLGCVPAISFMGRTEDAIQSAYVAPLPETRNRSFLARSIGSA